MCKPLTTVPQTSAHLGRQLKRKQQVIQERAVCIVKGENQYPTANSPPGWKENGAVWLQASIIL